LCLEEPLLELSLCGNNFEQIPHALASITILRMLNMAHNEHLRFKMTDTSILSKMPLLNRLHLYKQASNSNGSNKVWSNEDVRVLLAIAKQAPHLRE
jgi:hypothetical protein